MNSLKIKVDKSDYDIYYDFLNYLIDDFWLDEKLDEIYPNMNLKGLIPTLLGMENIEEEKIVWNRILPKENNISICPILMCPDDCDFSCTIIVAEIKNLGKSVMWNKIGIDITADFHSEAVGQEVEWLDKIGCFEFSDKDYNKMLLGFKSKNGT